MTEMQAVSIEDVRLLVAERQRYDDWIAALEAKRGETPARVFDRVHGDYSARRAGVMERLREHVGTLAALGNDLETRLADLEGKLASLEDERIEAMLRTSVGEFDSDRWDTIRKQVEASIAEHTDERDLLLMEVDDVRTLLASAGSEPPRAAPADEPPSTASEPELLERSESLDVSLDTIATVQPAAESVAAPTAPVLLDVTDELMVVSLEGSPDDERAASALLDLDVAPESDADARSAAEALELEDALVLFTPDTTEQRLAQDRVAPAPSAAVAPSAMPASMANEATGAAPVEAFDDLAFLRSVIDPAANGSGGGGSVAAAPRASATEPQKTLRCTECGTMNLPTEWYCERCGGELAAF